MNSNLSFEMKSEEAMGQIPLGFVGPKSDIRREQERVKSMVLGKAGEINSILKVKAGTEPNSWENVNQQHPWIEALKALWA